MSKNELPEGGDWESVEVALHRRMKRLDMSIARLSRESGVSEPTIRYIGRHEKRQRSTLVALSAALGYRHDYFVNVLLGTPEDLVPGQFEEEILELFCRIETITDLLVTRRKTEEAV